MRHPLIRTIYLYLFALVGLAMLVVGAARIVNVGLKAWVFTAADQREVFTPQRPPVKVGEATSSEAFIEPPEMAKIDFAKREQQRDLASSISIILVGLPLYLYHWGVIKRDTRNSPNSPKV